jgi:hypothetical protein
MFTAIVLVAVLAVLYGLAWHNQPVKARENNRRDERKE